jgi:hypothetical protein
MDFQKLKSDFKKMDKANLIFLFPIFLILWVQGICLGLWFDSSVLAQSARAAGLGWNAAGFVLFAASVYWIYLTAIDSNKVFKDDIVNGVLFFVGLALSIWAYTGFTS